MVVRWFQAGRATDRAVDILDTATRAADHVVMVVVRPALVACWRSGRLDPPNHPFLGQGAESVIYRLPGHGPDPVSYRIHQLISRGMGASADGVEHGDTLRGDLQAMPP